MQIYKAHKEQTVARRQCPQQNKCVFRNRRNSRKVCSESCRWTWRGPTTVNERSPRLVRVLGTSHIANLPLTASALQYVMLNLVFLELLQRDSRSSHCNTIDTNVTVLLKYSLNCSLQMLLLE